MVLRAVAAEEGHRSQVGSLDARTSAMSGSVGQSASTGERAYWIAAFPRRLLLAGSCASQGACVFRQDGNLNSPARRSWRPG